MSIDHKLISKNIIKYRIMNNLSQKELAKSVKIMPTSLSAIERGRKKASVNLLLHIADVLNINLDMLLEGNLKYTKANICRNNDNEFTDKMQTLSLKQKEIFAELLNAYFREVKNSGK